MLHSLRFTAASALLLAAACPLFAATIKRAETPMDLILVVDVSLSMSKNSNTLDTVDGKIVSRATDPDGIRWDGIQFLIDTANDNDRVALVLFQTDAVLVTAGIEGQSNGFVEMKHGRKALKEAVKRLQQHELTLENAKNQISEFEKVESPLRKKNPEDNRIESFVPVPTVKGETVWAYLGTGTANVLTLRSLPEMGLLKQPPGPARPRFVLLFTDGVDECDARLFNERSPDVSGWENTNSARVRGAEGEPKVFQWGSKTLSSLFPERFLKFTPTERVAFFKEKDWQQKLEKMAQSDSKSLSEKKNASIDEVMKPFEEVGANVFTFGLGKEIDKSMLERIVTAARPAAGGAKNFRGAAFFSRDNLTLFEQLQSVGWELRERWKVQSEFKRRNEMEVGFSTPALEVCQDLGAFLYTKAGQQGKQARAPKSSILQPGKPPITARSFTSRSHDYLQILPDAGSGIREISVQHPADQIAVCEFGLRPITPEVQLAELSPVGYTLLDAVPIHVDFEDIETAKLEPEMFQVRARIFRNGPDGSPQSPYDLMLIPLHREPGATKWGFSAKWNIARTAFESKIPPVEFCGEWNLDVEIETVCSDEKYPDHPLGKAKRKLLRRQFSITGYPKIKLPDATVIRTHGQSAGRGRVILTLDTKFAADDLILPNGDVVRAEFAWLGTAFKYPTVLPVTFKGKSGLATADLEVDLTKLDWGQVARNGLRAQVKAESNIPDGLVAATAKPQKVEFGIDLRKSDYLLEIVSDKLVFELSNSKEKDPKVRSAQDETRLHLKTDLIDQAIVKFEIPADAIVQFRRVPPPGEVASDNVMKLRCTGNEPTAYGAVPSGVAKRETPLSLTLRPLDEKPLLPGRYEAAIPLRATAGSPSPISAKELRLIVLVDQLNINFVGYRKDKLESMVLAGTTVEWPITLEMALLTQGTKVMNVKARPKQSPQGSGDISLPAVRLVGMRETAWQTVLGAAFGARKPHSADMEYRLAVEVPESADNGDYRFELEFQLEALTSKGETKTFAATGPIAMQVQRYGLTALPVVADGVEPADRVRFELPVGSTQVVEKKMRLTPTLPGTVRWTAEVVASPGAPLLKAGEKPWFDGLELLAADAGSPNVLHRPSDPPETKRATTPLAKGAAQDLSLKLTPGPLAPGRYGALLRFTPRIEGVDVAAPNAWLPAGSVVELPIEFVVSGLVPSLNVDPSEKTLRVAVRGVKSRIGEWKILSDDHPGWEEAIVFAETRPDEITTLATGSVTVPQTRGGPCRFKLVAVGQTIGSPPPMTATVPAQITLHKSGDNRPANEVAKPGVPKRLLFAGGDIVIVRIRLTAGAAPPPALQARRKDDPNTTLPIVLSDDGKNGDIQAGDGEFSGQFTFPTEQAAFGEYTIGLDPMVTVPYKIEGESCLLGLARTADPRSDTLEHSKGLFELIYGPSQVSALELARVKIQSQTLSNPRYRLRVKYLIAGSDAERDGFLTRKQIPTTDQFDPKVHFAAKAIGPLGEAGDMPKETWIPFGLEIDLSAEAQKAIEEGHSHPSIEQKSGIILVLTITGKDPQGRDIEWEEEIPYQVKPKNFYFRTGLVWLIAGLIALPLSVFAFIRWRRWKARKGKARVSHTTDGKKDILTEHQSPKLSEIPAANSPADPSPRKASRPKGDDLF